MLKYPEEKRERERECGGAYGVQLLLHFARVDRTHMQHRLLAEGVEFIEARLL